MQKFNVSSYIRNTVSEANVYMPPIFEKYGHRLYMNENMLGPSPKCLDVLKEVCLDDLSLYSCGGNKILTERLHRYLI